MRKGESTVVIVTAATTRVASSAVLSITGICVLPGIVADSSSKRTAEQTQECYPL